MLVVTCVALSLAQARNLPRWRHPVRSGVCRYIDYNHDQRGSLKRPPTGAHPWGEKRWPDQRDVEFLERWGAKVRVAIWISAHFEIPAHFEPEFVGARTRQALRAPSVTAR